MWLKGIMIFVGLIVLVFVLELAGLGFFKFFEPKREDIRREIFENTKSFVHGKIQQLSKYHNEYRKADDSTRLTLETIIRLEFAEFDETKIDAVGLRRFLTQIRGY